MRSPLLTAIRGGVGEAVILPQHTTAPNPVPAIRTARIAKFTWRQALVQRPPLRRAGLIKFGYRLDGFRSTLQDEPMSTVQVQVDRNSRTPLHVQLAQQLEAAIQGGALPVGSRLSNEVDLAEAYGLSRPTVRQAIARLVDQGLLVRKRGVGTQVVGNSGQVRRSLELTSLYDDLTSAHRKPETDVLRFGISPATAEVATALQCELGDRVLRLERLRRADGEPLALMRNWLPPEILETDPATLAERGLYQLLRAEGVRLKVAHQTISAVPATPEQAKLLSEEPGSPLLATTRITYDDHGQPVEYGSHLYRASRYSFEHTLVHR
jgi:DNA-binding GntR family transcriptional regulator